MVKAYTFVEDKKNNQEFANLKSQIVTSGWGGLRRALPYAFTEQGVAMLSGLLNSRRVILVNMEGDKKQKGLNFLSP